MVNGIDASLLLATKNGQTRKTGNDILGKDDFLKILMTQLQNQDPMNPLQDKDFIAQMATFSSLEQMTNMSKSLERFVSSQQQNSLITYNSFIGKEINWHKLIENEDKNIPPVIQEGSGKVSSIQFKEDKVTLIMEDGTTLEPSNISKVNETSSESHVLQASALIGKTVTFLNDKKEEISAVVKSVNFKSGKISYQLDDEAKTSITAAQITKIE